MSTLRTPVDHGILVVAVEAAILAPSMHNCQPWRFRLGADTLEVHADPARNPVLADATGWGMRVACGAAIANARLALAHAGIQVSTALRPDQGHPDLVGVLQVTGSRPPTPYEEALHAAIPKRHSNRQPFTDAPVPPSALAALRRAAEENGAWLDLLIGRGPVALVAAIVDAADRVLRDDAAYRAELSQWSAARDSRVDGITRQTAGPGPQSQDLLAMRDFGGPTRAPGRDFEADPVVAVLGTPGDTAVDQLVAGIALQHLLLAATDAGLATSLLSQPIEVPAAREQLRLGLGRYGAPQILARIGYGQPAFAAPRRPLADVLDG